jgi:hypothetical protein
MMRWASDRRMVRRTGAVSPGLLRHGQYARLLDDDRSQAVQRIAAIAPACYAGPLLAVLANLARPRTRLPVAAFELINL